METFNKDESNVEIEGQEEDESSTEVNDLPESFDFENFSNYIAQSVFDDSIGTEDVDLKNYLLAFEQLHSFFLLLGKAFQFIARDVKSKIRTLHDFHEEEIKKCNKSTNFSTVRSMVNFEKGSGALKNSKYVSGSRTLLRLHRGLDFVRKFLTEIYNADANSKLNGIAREVYDQTLAEYHTWIIKNGARIAMQFLPTRAELLNKISKNNAEELNKIMEMFPNSLEAMNVAYDRVQIIYNDNEILNLP